MLKDSSSRIRHALFTHTACIVFSPDGHIIDASPAFLSVVGYSLADIKGQHHRLFCTAEDVRRPEYQKMWDGFKRGLPADGTFRRVAHDGRDVWLKATYFPISDRFGRVPQVMKIANDITVQHEELISKDAVLSALNASMAVIEFTPNGTILNANDNFLSTVGYALGDIKGRHHGIFCPESFYRDHPNFWDELADGEFKQGKFERVTASGQPCFLEATYNPVRDGDGHVTKVVKFATDITYSVQAAEAAKQAVHAAQSTSTQTEKIAVDSLDHLRAVVASVEKTASEVAEAQSMINSLSAQAQSITAITTSIARIADQTNLLSLNAAVEAARAGEQGKGFAVVASEVRSLAKNASESAKQIAQVLSENQALTNKAASKMEEVAGESSGSKERVAAVEDIMVEILSGAQSVSRSIDQLSA